jgi:predicted amidohydrolase
MARALPVLLMQQPGLVGNDWAQCFETDLRARMVEFPRSLLVVYPELHLCPPATADAAERLAEPMDGPRMKLLQKLAADLNIWLVPGSVFERDTDGRIYNTAVAIAPDGDVVARYRKCFPWRPFENVTAGSEFVVFDIPGVTRIGVSICYDTWFPEVARHLAWMGAEVILQPTRTHTVDRAQELVLSQATAITNQVFVISINAAAPAAAGQSLIVDPEGRVLVQAGATPVSLTNVLILDAVDVVRDFGTAGITRVWSQFQPDDPPIPLPLYGGAFHPRRWTPARRYAYPGVTAREDQTRSG